MRTEIKIEGTGSYMRLDTVTYSVPYIQACLGCGVDRIATAIPCGLDLECLADGTPNHIYISDLGTAEDLYEQLGEFIRKAKAKGYS